MLAFLKAYIKSMRIYYSFVTGITGWVGIACYKYHSSVKSYTLKDLAVLCILFLVWGVSQIFNDYFGLKEDKINAPHRPMVTGELNKKWALIVSSIILTLIAGITYLYLQPIALIPLIIGSTLNLIYEPSKGYGICGNIVYASSITSCAAYGFLALSPVNVKINDGIMLMTALIWVFHFLMCYFSYFKDYEGDKLAGKNTIIVKYGVEKAKIIGLLISFLPLIIYIVIFACGVLPFEISFSFLTMFLIATFLQIRTGFLYFKYSIGEKTYFSLKTSTRACVCNQALIISFFNQHLAIQLFLISYVLVGTIFDLYKNSKE